MTYTIMPINCPILNNSTIPFDLMRKEDFIRFDNLGELTGITCSFYNEGDCSFDKKRKSGKCLYSSISWRDIKSPDKEK